MASDSKIVRSLFKGGTIIFIGLIISKLFSLIYRVIVGRALGPEEYGVISIMLAVSSVIGALAYIGIPQGVQKYVSEYRSQKNKENQVETVKTGLILVSLPSIVTGLLLFILAPWLSIEIFNEPRAIWPLRFIAVILPMRAWRKVLIRTTEAYEKMQYKVYTHYFYQNITKVILTVALLILGYGYLGAAAAFAFAWGTGVILAIYFSQKILPEIFTLSKPKNKQYSKLLHHSWPLFAAGLFASIAGYIDTFMLQALLGSEEVGLYNAAYPFAAALTFAGSAFGSIYLSNASKLYGNNQTEEIGSAYSLVVKWTALISIPAFTVMIAFPTAILQLFGNEYLVMNNVLRILALGFLFSALVGPATKVIQAVDKTKYKLYLTVFIGASNITLNYLLIPIYGITGAAMATAATFIIAFAAKILVVKHLIKSFTFRPSIIKILISATTSTATIYLIFKALNLETSIIALPIAVILTVILYLVLLLLNRTLGEEDLTVLKYIKEKTGLKNKKIEQLIKRYS